MIHASVIYTKFLKYFAIAVINARSRFAYVAAMLSEIPLLMLRLWIMSQFYAITYASSNRASFDELTYVQLLWALMFIQCFESSATEPHVTRIIEEEVKSGAIAYSVNKPYSFILFQYVGHLGRTFANIWLFLVVSIALMLVLVGPVDITVHGALLGLLLMMIGHALNFFIELSVGLLAFWIEDIGSIEWLMHSLTIIFGGIILPLAMFPDHIKYVAELLPFGQIYYTGGRLMVHYDYPQFISFLKLQLFWLTVFSILVYILWHKGMKNVSISGG